MIEDLDIFLFKFPILPSSMDHLISMPFPSIFGYDKESCHFDLIVDLEKGQIVNNNNDNNIDLSIISQFPYRDKLISKVENLLNNSLNAMIIPNKNNLNTYTQFIQNADESIYPQCFQYFAQTRYILTENLIIKLMRLLTYPFLSYLKNFVNKSIIIDESDPNMPIAKFDKKEFLNRISDIYMKFVSTLAQTETFNQLGMKLEVEKVDKIIFKQKKKYISERIENSVKHKRSNSLPIKNKLPKLIE